MISQKFNNNEGSFREQVYAALKCYRRAKDLEGLPATQWLITQIEEASTKGVVNALRTVIQNALNELKVTYPLECEIVTLQYIEGKTVFSLGEHFNLSERTVYRKSERGVSELALMLERLEKEALTTPQLSGKAQRDTGREIFIELLGENLTITKKILSNYYQPREMSDLVGQLSDLDVSSSDRTRIISRMHDVYEASHNDDLQSIIARQNSIYLLGTFAALESFSLLDRALSYEKHPWPKRAALLGCPSSEKYEAYLQYLRQNDQAREVARTFPRVFYGDQSPQSGLFHDDRKPNYAKTLQFYLTNYPRFLDESSLALVIYVCRDIIATKGDLELRRNSALMEKMKLVLQIEPLNPLARREWLELGAMLNSGKRLF